MYNMTATIEVLILRVWIEDSDSDGLRVRIIQLTDDQSLVLRPAATIDDACAAVRAWLQDFVRKQRHR
jgi:hypothetical protein